MILPYFVMFIGIFLVLLLVSFLLKNDYLLLITGLFLLLLGLFVVTDGISMPTGMNITSDGTNTTLVPNYTHQEGSLSSANLGIIFLLVGLLIVLFSLFGGL
jgi:hypothetical protein